MPEDLPIYADSMLRSGRQFADLDPLKGRPMESIWQKADRFIALMEGASNLVEARTAVGADFSKASLIQAHSILFRDRPRAGVLRAAELRPLYRGQDCAPPEFIDRSLDNLFTWV